MRKAKIKPVMWVLQPKHEPLTYHIDKRCMVHRKLWYPCKLVVKLKHSHNLRQTKRYYSEYGGFSPNFYDHWQKRKASWYRRKQAVYDMEDSWYAAKTVFYIILTDRRQREDLCIEYGILDPYGDEMNTLMFLMKPQDDF